MVKNYKLPRCFHKLPKQSNYSKKNINRILHLTIIWNQHLNSFLWPFPIHWNRESEKYTIYKTWLQIFWILPIYRFAQIVLFTSIALHGPFNTATKLPQVSPAIFCISIASLIIISSVDILVILFASDVVNCFGWADQMSQDFLCHFKFGKLNYILITSGIFKVEF